MSAYDSYRLYNALKLHFNSESYNYFKYHGKIRSKTVPQNQVYIFDKLDKKYGMNLEDFYVSNFIEDQNIWVFDLVSEECNERYVKFQKKKESLTYTFKNDIISLLDEYDDLNKILLVDADFPILMRKVLQETISLETLLILNSIIKFFRMWENKIQDEYIWKDFKMKCIKYYPFIHFDKKKFKDIILQEIKCSQKIC